jgi:hypothetical protein
MKNECQDSTGEEWAHEYRFGYFVGEQPRVTGQQMAPRALYYCIHCLHEEVKDVPGIMIPSVGVQLMQAPPPPDGILNFPRGR